MIKYFKTTFFIATPGKELNLYNILFNRLSAALSLVIIVFSFILPPDGLGIRICLFDNVFNLPCPGCGMTRSITSISHLMFEKAFFYHPFGFMFYPLIILMAAFNFFSIGTKNKIKTVFTTRAEILKKCYLFLIYSFIIFGTGRFLYHLTVKDSGILLNLLIL